MGVAQSQTKAEAEDVWKDAGSVSQVSPQNSVDLHRDDPVDNMTNAMRGISLCESTDMQPGNPRPTENEVKNGNVNGIVSATPEKATVIWHIPNEKDNAIIKREKGQMTLQIREEEKNTIPSVSQEMVLETLQINNNAKENEFPIVSREKEVKTPKRQYCPWSTAEEEALLLGMRWHGRSWQRIKDDPDFKTRLSGRSSLNLKDKWRNLSDSFERRIKYLSALLDKQPQEERERIYSKIVPTNDTVTCSSELWGIELFLFNWEEVARVEADMKKLQGEVALKQEKQRLLTQQSSSVNQADGSSASTPLNSRQLAQRKRQEHARMRREMSQ